MMMQWDNDVTCIGNPPPKVTLTWDDPDTGKKVYQALVSNGMIRIPESVPKGTTITATYNFEAQERLKDKQPSHGWYRNQAKGHGGKTKRW